MPIRDFAEYMDFRLGIDDTNGNIRGAAVTASAPVTVPGTGGQTVYFRLRKCETVDDLNQATGLSVDASGAYGLFAASDKFNFAQSSNFHSYSLFLVVVVSVTNTSSHIMDEQLVQAGQTLLAQGTGPANKRFREEFGDFYIKGLETGGEYMAIVEIETRSDQEKLDISNKLEAGGFFGVGGADLSTTFTNNFESLTANNTLNITSFQRGGAGAGAQQQVSVGALIEKAQNFPAQVLAAPVSYQVQLQDYLSLNLPTPPNTIDLQNAKDVLRQYEAQRAILLQLLNDVNYIESHTDQFESFNANDLTNLVQEVSSSLDAIKTAASQCANDIRACNFVPAVVPDRSKLPKRRGAPAPPPPPQQIPSTAFFGLPGQGAVAVARSFGLNVSVSGVCSNADSVPSAIRVNTPQGPKTEWVTVVAAQPINALLKRGDSITLILMPTTNI